MMGEKEKTFASSKYCQAEIGAKMIRIILCDDNQVFLESLRVAIRAILKKNKTESVIHTFASAEAIPASLLPIADIFFLDIDFVDKKYTGIDIAKKVRNVNETAVIIFVTNYIEYAPEGYEVQAFRYVLKSEVHSKLERFLQQALEKLQVVQETIILNISGETIVLPLADILYIESQAHTAVIYTQVPGTSKSKEYKLYATLTSLERQLESQGFLRIQKSFLVNMRRIQKYQCTEAILDTGKALKVSQKSYAEQKKKYLLWKGGK